MSGFCIEVIFNRSQCSTVHDVIFLSLLFIVKLLLVSSSAYVQIWSVLSECLPSSGKENTPDPDESDGE